MTLYTKTLEIMGVCIPGPQKYPKQGRLGLVFWDNVLYFGYVGGPGRVTQDFCHQQQSLPPLQNPPLIRTADWPKSKFSEY